MKACTAPVWWRHESVQPLCKSLEDVVAATAVADEEGSVLQSCCCCRSRDPWPRIVPEVSRHCGRTMEWSIVYLIVFNRLNDKLGNHQWIKAAKAKYSCTYFAKEKKICVLIIKLKFELKPNIAKYLQVLYLITHLNITSFNKTN